jgi:hypothetical protein
LLAPVAYADQAEPSAWLACKGDAFAVRFNLGFALEPMKEPFASKWSAVELKEDSRRILSTGQKVILKWKQLPNYAWGAGGADAPATYSLWIDSRLLASGTFKRLRGAVLLSQQPILLSRHSHHLRLRPSGERPDGRARRRHLHTNQFNQHFASAAAEIGWHLLGGNLTPFIWHTEFRMDGKLYTMAVPETAYFNTNPTPTAELYEPFTAGQMRGVVEVCTFQLTAF